MTRASPRLETLTPSRVAIGTRGLIAKSAFVKRLAVLLVHVAITLEGVPTRAELAAGQRHALVAEVTFPTDLTRADVGSDTLAVFARPPFVVANGDRAGITRVDQVDVVGLFPAAETDDVGVLIAEVAMRLFEVLGHAGVLVVLQRREDARERIRPNDG